MEITFTNPNYLWILLIIPIMILTHVFTLKRSRSEALKFSNFEAIERVAKGVFLGKPYQGLFKSRNLLLLMIRLLTYSMLIFAITGATLWYEGEISKFDYVVALDASSSMMADDFEPSRLEASKKAISSFIDNIPRAKIGIVSFSGTSFVEIRPTEEKEEVMQANSMVSIKEVGGTNIGDAIIIGANLLEESENKAIVLLTDGRSNTGTSPEEAAEYAKDNNVIVHTMGVGTEEGGVFMSLNVTSTIDEDTLQYVANATSGRYFKAEDAEKLENAFSSISQITTRKLSMDLSWILLLVAFGLLSLEWILVNTRYRTIP